MTAKVERQLTYLLYSATNADNLATNLGRAEYSYYFVRETFRAMLEKRGPVLLVTKPELEADIIHDKIKASGQDCVLLAFCPPHCMPPTTRCPTVPVFAWEFDTIPNEIWDDDERNDWRTVLSMTGSAITHSRYSAQVIKDAMGPNFPVEAIPAPVWDDFQSPGAGVGNGPLERKSTLELKRPVVDSRRPLATLVGRRSLATRLVQTLRYGAMWYHDVVADSLPRAAAKWLEQFFTAVLGSVAKWRLKFQDRRINYLGRDTEHLDLQGVIFLSVFSPKDGRKNWVDMLTAFCYSFADCADATLILKFIGADCLPYVAHARSTLAKLAPFQCRVIVIDEFLDSEKYHGLLASSTFAVNSSFCEGQCLPLMEALSCGKPVISPRHTGMNDYIDEQVAFVLRSSEEICSWPHDPRHALRARRYRIDWQSLVEAYRAAYTVAKKQPEHYYEMSRAAVERMKEFCSEHAVYKKLHRFVLTAAVTTPLEDAGVASTDPLSAADSLGGGLDKVGFIPNAVRSGI